MSAPRCCRPRRRRPRRSASCAGLRENLFSTWLNSLLTIVVIAFAVWWLAAHILPWCPPCGLGRRRAARVPRDHRRPVGRGGGRRLLGGDPRALEAVPLRLLPVGPLLAPDAHLLHDAGGAGAGAVRRGAAPDAVVLDRLPGARILAALGRLADGAARSVYALALWSAIWSSTASSPTRLAEPARAHRRRAGGADLVALSRRPGRRRAWPACCPSRCGPCHSQQFGGFMLSLVIGVTGITLSLPLGILLALGPAVGHVHRQDDLRRLHRVHPRRAADHALAVHASLLLNYFLPPGTNFDIILRVIIMVTLFAVGLHGRGDPGRPRGAAARPVRGGGRARSRLLAGACG